MFCVLGSDVDQEIFGTAKYKELQYLWSVSKFFTNLGH